jgi:hypothetical protein
MADQQVFRLRWRGCVSGPSVEQLNTMLTRKNISLMHELEARHRWVSLEEFLATAANKKSQKMTPSIPNRRPYTRGIIDRMPLARMVPDLAVPSFSDMSRGQAQPRHSQFGWQEFSEAVFKVLLVAGGISILILFLWAASKGGVRVPTSDHANHPLIIIKRGQR